MTYDLVCSEAHGTDSSTELANSSTVAVVLYLAPSSSVRLISKCIYKVCAKLLAKSKEVAVSKASKQPLVRPRPVTTPLCPLWEVYCNVLVSVRASLLVRYPELRGVRYSEGRFVLVNILEDRPGVRCHRLEDSPVEMTPSHSILGQNDSPSFYPRML